jgi:signal transduction histidine kinase
MYGESLEGSPHKYPLFMKKMAILLVLGIFAPALVLGILALQSARQQGVLIADQEAKLRQQQADNLAAQMALSLRIEHEAFIKIVEQFIGRLGPEALSTDFNRMLAENWQRKSVGFCVDGSGKILSPHEQDYPSRQAAWEFIKENTAFLTGRVSAEVYPTSSESLADVQETLLQSQNTRMRKSPLESAEDLSPPIQRQAPISEKKAEAFLRAENNPAMSTPSAPEPKDQLMDKQDARSDYSRKVAPQNISQSKEGEKFKLTSSLEVSTSRFRELVAKGNSGILSRFVNDRLEILFWFRSEKRPDLIFGARLLAEDLHDVILQVLNQQTRDEAVLVTAVLDDHTRPFVQSDAEFSTKWQNPFVAAEIGEVLPHWEIGLYLRDAQSLSRTAAWTSYIIMGLIAVALGAIAAVGSLVVRDMRRQMVLVQKKTDFVSNVSHELKTPLTSIRMFAELLQQGARLDTEKRTHYLRIITVEAERLTRLINNVLDFARMERHEKVYQKELIDLQDVLRQVWESQELHLHQMGFRTLWKREPVPYPVYADADAMAQILINLLSNAEKYSAERKEVELHSYVMEERLHVSVCDRGVGVPAGEEKKIFEHFYRAHDSLSSGIQGTGLGLTLAQKMAEDHDGVILCEARKDGGMCFTLQLPLIKTVSRNTL